MERTTKIRAKIKASDGATFEVNGPFEERVAFGVYMLLCEWGNRTPKPRKKADKEFEEAARAFLEASERFHAVHK